jgi:hypothetical protein
LVGNAAGSIEEKSPLRSAWEGISVGGGINPKIMLSTGKPGYFAVATSKEQDGQIVGWSGPLSTAEAATKEVMENCRRRDGSQAQRAAGMSGQKLEAD